MGIKKTILEWLFSDIYNRLDELGRKEERDMSELSDALAAVAAQLEKAKEEILSKIAALEGQIGTIPPDAQANLDAVKAIAQALDDVVPDVPA